MPLPDSSIGSNPGRLSTPLSANLAVVHRCLDGSRRNDHDQILKCLTDDIEWTVFGAYTVRGKAEFQAVIKGPEFAGDPDLHTARMVERNDMVMAKSTGEVPRLDGSIQRLSMAELFVMREGLICERRAWVIPTGAERSPAVNQ